RGTHPAKAHNPSKRITDFKAAGRWHGACSHARRFAQGASMALFTYRFVSRVVLVLGVSVSSLSGCLADTLESSEGAGTNDEGITGSLPVGTQLKAKGNVNLRSAPSTSASVLTVVAAGSTVTLQSAAPSDGFYNISYNGTLGWSSGKYFEPASGGSTGSAP